MTATLALLALPDVPGLTFRLPAGEADYPDMALALDAFDDHRGIASVTTVEDVATVYRNLTNCDPERDMVCAEVDGRLVAYSRVLWWDEVAGDDRIYFSAGFVHPRWQGRGIASAFVDWNLARLAEISGGHDTPRRRVVDSFALTAEGISLLEGHGF